MKGGGFNQDIVNSRTSAARGDIERQLKSRNASNKAALAARGLVGDGAEFTAMDRANEDMFNQYMDRSGEIYADESENADKRMMQAVQTAAGLSAEQAKLVIDKFRAESDDKIGMGQLGVNKGRLDLDAKLGQGRLDLDNELKDLQEKLGLGQLDLGYAQNDTANMIGQGNIAVANMNGMNNYNLGLGQQGLDRDRLLLDAEQGDIDSLIKLISQLYQGADTSAGGYI
jgi:hypothetical protein